MIKLLNFEPPMI